MSMIEKFLEAKESLRNDLAEIKEEALKVASDKADKRIDEFVEGFKIAIADASDEEFIAFITSGKLDDDDILAAITFRHEAGKDKAKVCSEPCGQQNVPNEKREPNVHVFVLEV